MEVLYILFFLYLILFWISIKIKDNSIVDIFWGLWFLVIAFYLFINTNIYSIEKVLVLLLLSIWWLRLSYYIFKRKRKNQTEDPRYAKWRKSWKYFYTRSFFQVYILQMILMLIVSTPLFFIFSEFNINTIYFLIWFLLSIIWLALEIISDNQVKKYLKSTKEKNKVYTWWLYKYSRNPNYFWESIFWLWISIIWSSISLYSFVWFLVITFLLLFVSWVAMKEVRQSKKDNWKQYKEKTSVFIPWFPKK